MSVSSRWRLPPAPVSHFWKMGRAMQQRVQDESTPTLSLSTAIAAMDHESSAHDGYTPTPWQRPCSSNYSVESSPLEEVANEPIQSSQLSGVARRTAEPITTPIQLPPTARRRSGTNSVDTLFSIPIIWQPHARPRSSIYSVESLSWGELTARVDESMAASHLEAIARLTEEKDALQKKLLRYRRSWHEFNRLFSRLLSLTLHIRSSLDQYDNHIMAVEAAWLARWGIAWV